VLGGGVVFVKPTKCLDFFEDVDVREILNEFGDEEVVRRRVKRVIRETILKIGENRSGRGRRGRRERRDVVDEGVWVC